MTSRVLLARVLTVAGAFFAGGLAACLSIAAQADALHAAILPNHIGHLTFRADRVTARDFYATIINDTDFAALNCRIEVAEELPFEVSYWTTEPVLNRFVGEQNTPADIPPRGSQSFRFTLKLLEDLHLPQQRLGFEFVCDTHVAAVQAEGINDVVLSAGKPDIPSVLLAMATPDANNRVVLYTRLGDGKCVGRTYYREEPAPCAIGVMALAMLNNSPEPLELDVEIRSDGPDGLLCRTDAMGECTSATEPSSAFAPATLVLQPGEFATFSAFLLAFRDGYFDYGSFDDGRGPRQIGFAVYENSPLPYVRRRQIATTSEELVSPAFEWSAVLSDGQITVEGSVSVPNSCGSGVLALAADAPVPANELQLELRQADAPPGQLCLAVTGVDRVSWTSTGSVAGVERVVVSYNPASSSLADTVVLPVER